MLTKVFLSLSFADADFVRSVHSRLPRGLATFYEQSFASGVELMEAMEGSVAAAEIFVLFASSASLKSKAVLFEIDRARMNVVFGKGTKLLIFPTDSSVTFSDLPEWLQSRWMTNAGYTAPDVARYITNTLLGAGMGGFGSPTVWGRGGTSDRLDTIVGKHLAKYQRMPNAIVLAGLQGIGRRTFARHFLHKNLTAEPNLAYGPTITLPRQADDADLYRALRSEVDLIPPPDLANDVAAFTAASENERTLELHRLLAHFWNLRQAVILVSASGFFEDNGALKHWAADLINSLPDDALLLLVTNGQIRQEEIDNSENTVQIRVEELSSDAISTLMTHSATSLGLGHVDIPKELLEAIGGHPDVANAAISLANQKGVSTLVRQPAQLMNIQQTLLGELVEEEVLSDHEKAILDVLCWVPGLGGDLLFETVALSEGLSEDQATDAVQALLLKCLITVSGFVFSVSPAIRHLYRRRYVTPAATTNALAETLSSAWVRVENDGAFREDLFEASIYVQTMRGTPVPEGLRNLITPGFLEGLVKETFARAKNTENADDLRRVISLGQMAFDMKMTDAVREEIYGTTARAQIRASDFEAAAETIQMMETKGYVNAVFLLGYMYRKQENYPEAIRVLKDAVTRHKHDRAAINELAQAYKRSDDFSALRQLLEQHKGMVPKSAMLTDFQIGLDLADGNMPEVEAGIARLKAMPDDDGRSDRREATLLIKKGRFPDAQRLLTAMLEKKGASYFLVRSLRAKAAIHAPDHRQAQRDIDAIKVMPGRAPVALRLQIELEAARGQLPQAEALMSTLGELKPHDFLLKALVLEKKADQATIGMIEATRLRKEAAELRGRYRGGHDRYEE